MKKILCCMVLMMAALTISATTQLMAQSPPEYDIGYSQTIATLSIDGQAVVSFDSQMNIVDLQTPVVLNMEVSNMSVQVVNAYSIPTPQGEISMTLANYKWPNTNYYCTPQRSDLPIFTEPVRAVNIRSFTTQRTDLI